MPLPPPCAEEDDGVVEWMLLRAAGRDLAADFGASGRMLPDASMKTMIDAFVDETRRREPASGQEHRSLNAAKGWSVLVKLIHLLSARPGARRRSYAPSPSTPRLHTTVP